MKTKLTKRLISMLMAIAIVACFVGMAIVPTSASEADVRATASGILHFGKFYNDVYLGSGSCFIINEDTIVTANHCACFTKLEYDYLNEKYGWTKKQIDSGFSYKVTLARDFTIDAKLINSSENMDFAILRLSQPIKNRTFLKLRDSATVEAAETVYAVGFPAAKDSSTINAQYYNERDIAFESGTVNRKQYTDSFVISSGGSRFQFSGDVLMVTAGTTTAGNSGGPLVDADGNVIGVCSFINAGGSYASAISQVIEILDALDVPYTPAGGVAPPVEETVASEPDDSSVEETAAVEETTPVVAADTDVKAEDDSDGFPMMLVIGIAALAVIVIAAVIIIIVVSSKKKGDKGAAPAAPAPAQAPAANSYGQQAYNRPPTPPVPPVNSGAGETSVLSSGAGETTVLGGGATGFCLIRKSNNEKVSINKPEFVIGKERRRVDYCISDDNSVSRTHAKVRVRSGKCYITDLGSTNCTYVNGVKLSPNQEVELKSGDKIKISDIEFDFNG